MGRLSDWARDLKRATNNGTEIRLKSGTTIVIRSTTYQGLGRVEQAFPTWLGKVFRYFEQGGGVSPAQLDSDAEALLRELRMAVPDWREPLRFIIADSNPDLEIDEQWMAANLSLPDIRRIFAAWIEENELADFVQAIKKKGTAYLTGLMTRAAARTAGSSGTSSSPS